MVRKLLLSVATLLFSFALAGPVAAQEAAATGDVIIAGSAFFNSAGGEVNGEDGRKTSLVLGPTILLPFKDNLYIGGSLDLTSESQDGAGNTEFGVGPTAWYFVGDELFVAAGASYGSAEDMNSLAFNGGVGVLKEWMGVQLFYETGSLDMAAAEDKVGFNNYGAKFFVVARF